ncbi:protein PSK SIMULATOR 3-like isoform X2 [Andrographis paniculata]|uniref:protein PSK SIMULATOR 3-like isoform X2 n=1 Tax=Andrographis paniculata TaxID=175694 RepID=UPI0021E742C3|nr:protein PSK SIMULATOR 3-like isoform X2 [Andrographis paniculata]
MGARCSKATPSPNPYAGRSTDQEKLNHQGQMQVQRDTSKVVAAPATMEESEEKTMAAKESEDNPMLNKESSTGYANVSDDEFYDGIPRYQRSSYRKSRSLSRSKVAEVSIRLGSVGLGRAVDVLDILGSSVSNLNIKSGFVSGATTKNSELSILAFEVANTIVKGSNLMQSLSKRNIRHLKEVVLPAVGVQKLISDDIDELLSIVAADKREELKVFAGEVIRFGNRCKDPQWHNLDRFFEKRSRDRTPQAQLRETAESVMLQLMTSVQHTAELYQELHVLDKLEDNFKLKRLESLKFNSSYDGDRDNSLSILSAELKSQRKVVKNLKKKSMWSRSLEEVMEKLVDIVLFLNQEIGYTFGNTGEAETTKKRIANDQQTLGPAGLALHYANIVLLIDSIVARSSSIPMNSRDVLYQSLPPNLKNSLRTKMQSFHVEKELAVAEIKDEMEKTLHWLVQIATNTAKAHHGFGWVGEWANATGSELNRRTSSSNDVMRIETLHHADKRKTDYYILDLLLWLNYLIIRSKSSVHRRSILRSSLRSPAAPSKKFNQLPVAEGTTSSSNSSHASPGVIKKLSNGGDSGDGEIDPGRRQQL